MRIRYLSVAAWSASLGVGFVVARHGSFGNAWLLGAVGVVVLVRHLLGPLVSLLQTPRVEHIATASGCPAGAVTLVHGTFASDAPWTRREAELPAALLRTHPDDLSVYRLEWSGENSVIARARAAAALRTHVSHTQAQFPNTRHYIVAHSHGGNIAVNAMNDERVCGLVAGVVTLSTPFIVSRPRSLGKGTLQMLQIGAPLIAPLVVTEGLVLKYWPGVFSTHGTPSRSELFVMVASSVLWLLTSGAWIYLSQWIEGTVASGHLAPNQLLVIRSPGDEASLVLGLPQLASAMIHSGARTVSRFITPFVRKLMQLGTLPIWMWDDTTPGKAKRVWETIHAVLFTLLLVGLIFGALIRLVNNEVGLMVLALSTLPWLLFWCLIPIGLIAGFAVPAVFLAALHVVAGTAAFLLGPEFLVMPASIDVSVESEPEGQCVVKAVQASDEKESRSALMHSRAYQDQTVCDAVAAWVSW